LGLDRFDDDQATVFTPGTVGALRLGTAQRRRRLCAKQRSGSIQTGAADAVGQESVVADAYETPWNDMLEEAPQKFVDVECDDLVAIPVGVIAIAKRHGLTIKGNKTAIADGDPVRVGRQIREHLLGSSEWRLRVHDPFVARRSRQQDIERYGIGDDPLRNLQPAFPI